MNRGNIYASTADVLARTNVEEVMKSAKEFTRRLPTQDMLGIAVFYILLPAGFLYTVTFPLAMWFGIGSTDWLLRVIPLTFCWFNVYVNAWKMTRTGANSPDGSLLPSVQKAGFRYCHECQLNSPPRSFHCPVCQMCILRRDHHCSFVGCCIGHFNQRFFVAAAVNLWPIALACLIWNAARMFSAFAHVVALDAWKFMFPHIALVFGFVSLQQFLMVAAFGFSLMATLFISYLIAAQFYCFRLGQTRVEYLLDIHAYDLGFWANVAQGLGTRWPLAMLWPFTRSPLQSDGLSFRTREMEDVGKGTKYF